MICFDTGPVIWGVQKIATAGQEYMIQRTINYIKYLTEKRQGIMIPAPVVGEYLLGFTQQEREEQKRIIEQSFFVPALDIRAAAFAAELLGNREAFKTIQKLENITKNQLKIDAMIVAIAILNNAEKIITGDLQHFEKISKGKIPIEEVPIYPGREVYPHIRIRGTILEGD